MAKIARLKPYFQFKEGWLRTVRTSLGMSQKQLADRINATQPQINSLEKNEKKGKITLNSLEKTAAAMECELVYAFIPRRDLKLLMTEQAKKKAGKIVEETTKSMELEGDEINEIQKNKMINEIESKLLNEMPTRLWD